MEWISVKDRKPSEGQSVLVWDGSLNLDNEPNYDICAYHSGMFISGGYHLNTIKYWMKLPKPPRENGMD